MDDWEIELKAGFLEEASQAISDNEQNFLELEKDPSNTDLVDKIFRLAHNLKGSAKAVGFSELGAFTHEFE
ncbi:MAG TPA: Hpt domain-containing protein, partial [Oligoflexia bacterium]|nr:Hpt domain-containing protein [Oligoflexia bacterium]